MLWKESWGCLFVARDTGSLLLLFFQREWRAQLTAELFLRAFRRKRGMPGLFW